MPSPHRAAIGAVVTAQPQIAQRQVLITQTIRSGDAVFTTVLTLGSSGTGTDSPSAPAAPASGSSVSSSGGLTQEQIGIIVGCCVGAAVLVILSWCCLAMVRRRRILDHERSRTIYDTPSIPSSYLTSEISEPSVARWATYHRQRPPVRPEYTAIPLGPRWTANRASTTYVRR